MPLVGREVELAVLEGLLAKAVAARRIHHALIIGEAGVGKSRLVRQVLPQDRRPAGFLLHRAPGPLPGLWSDLAFWPLREIVSAHAGIEPADGPESIGEKLDAAIGEESDREWLLSRLRPLVGLPAVVVEREDNFTAWRLFLQKMARRLPLVLVIEDVHWASETTLAFLDHLETAAPQVPLLLITTARPEFAPRSDEVTVETKTRIDLRTLSADESARLAEHLATAAGRPDIADALEEACGGNALFAEELARYLSEQASHDGVGSAPARPDGILALIAARLDALPRDQRAVLTDASVVGRVFWREAVVAAGSPAETVPRSLDGLMSRDFLLAQPSSMFAGDDQYAFRHALTRQVAYSQLTRARRAHKHAGVAAWMEAKQAPGLADLLAYHFETAYDLARASGEHGLSSSVRLPAARALTVAGDQTHPLDVATAERHFRRAAELLTDQDPERPRVLGNWADALWESGREREALEAEDALIAALRAAGEWDASAAASAQRAVRSWDVDSSESLTLPQIADDLLRRGGDSADLVPVLEYSAFVCFSRDDRSSGMRAVSRAIEISERLSLPLPVRALCLRGISRCEEGDPAGFEDLEAALGEARDRGAELTAAAVVANLADQRCAYEGPAAAIGLLRQTLARAERRHDRATAASIGAALAFGLWWSGGCDEADHLLEELDPVLQERGLDLLVSVRSLASLSCLVRGRLEDAERLAASCELSSRSSTRFETRGVSLLTSGIVLGARGDGDTALAHLRACNELEGGGRQLPEYTLPLALACRTCLAAGDEGLARDLVAPLGHRALEECTRVSLEAALAEAHGDPAAADRYAEASRRWRASGVPFEQGWALLRRAALQTEVAPAEAEEAARAAHSIFRGLGAAPAAETAEGLFHLNA